MFTRRACGSVRSAISAQATTKQTATRSFAAFAATQNPVRAPSLADVKPDGAAEFNQRQKEFREGLIAAQKKKEQQESQCSPSIVTIFGGMANCVPNRGSAVGGAR